MKNTEQILDTLTANETKLQRFLNNKVGCPHTAADIFQIIAEKLLTKKNALATSNPRAYLYQTARNAVIDHYRFEERRAEYEAQCAEIAERVDHCGPERSAMANDSLSILNQSLAELPYLTRQIFFLYRVEGIKQAAIAKQLGLNLSTVEKRLAAALKHCRARLKAQEIYGISVPQTSTKQEA